MNEGSSSSPGPQVPAPFLRLLAPLALVLAALALIVVISGSIGAEDEPGAAGGGGQGGGSVQTGAGGEQRQRPPKTYTVQPGDSLGTIAEQFGIPLERLERLNDKLDPNALITGQALQLRR